jgi:hypothetical protein
MHLEEKNSMEQLAPFYKIFLFKCNLKMGMLLIQNYLLPLFDGLKKFKEHVLDKQWKLDPLRVFEPHLFLFNEYKLSVQPKTH